MMKWIVGLLLLANLLLFGWMRWGAALTVDRDAATAQAALNPDKIKLLGPQPASAVAASAPLAASSVGMSLTLSQLPTLPASAAVAAPAPSALPHELPKESSCAEWGEFSGSDLERAQQGLAALKLGERLAQHSVEHNHGYWVYIPPMRKRAEVERKVAQLKERGVTDYFVVQEKGKWLNAISLGVFRNKEAAQKYLAELRTKDVRTAKVGERMSKLRYTVFALKGLDAATADKLKALQKGFPDSELKLSTCGN